MLTFRVTLGRSEAKTRGPDDDATGASALEDLILGSSPRMTG
jgi:hypothetical protein